MYIYIYIYIYNHNSLFHPYRNHQVHGPPDDSYPTDETDCCGFLR